MNNLDETLKKSLEPWLNPPDYYEIQDMLKKQGILNSEIRKLRRDIDRKEDNITVDMEKPRSNETRKAKLAATAELKDKLAALESALAIVDSEVKFMDIRIKMFNAANYRTKIAYEI